MGFERCYVAQSVQAWHMTRGMIQMYVTWAAVQEHASGDTRGTRYEEHRAWYTESAACVTLRQGTQVTGLEAQQWSSLLGHKGPGACQWPGTQLAAAGASFLLSQRPVCFLPPPSCLFGCQRVGVSQKSGTQGTTHYPTSSHLGQGLGPSPWLGKSLPGSQIPCLRGSCELQCWLGRSR